MIPTLNKMDELKDINQCSLFKGMSEDTINHLLSKIDYQIKEKEKGEYIIHKDSHLKHLLILLDGIVSGETTDENGKIFHLTEHKAPIALATALLFGRDMGYPIDVVAKTNCTILQIGKNQALHLMQNNQTFLENYMEVVAERTFFLHNKITCFSLRTLKEKLLVYLLSLSKDQQSDTILITKSQNELAHYFGVNRPSLTREIRNLHNKGYILAKGKEISLLKKTELQKMVSCDSNTCINSLRR